MGGVVTALVIENERLVLGVFRTILQMRGFVVLAAETADIALRYCNDRRLEIDLVVADRLIPGASGTDVALKITAVRPDVPILLTSGAPLEYWTARDLRNLAALPKGSCSFLQKPFTSGTLMKTVGQLMNRTPASPRSTSVHQSGAQGPSLLTTG
jgi:two-component system cell cycle sensor histidine kinase/response regulator CckA